MSFKSIVRELKEMKDGIGNISRRVGESKRWRNRTRSYIAPDQGPPEEVEKGQWADIPPELLLDIIERIEASETSWPARSAVVYCASVCRPWREVVKDIVKTPEECGRLTFPISLKQPGPRESPIQCFIKRDRAASTFLLYLGLTPSENGCGKLLLAARKIRRATGTDFVISFVSDDFSRASNTYVGKLRSNFLGTKFTIYDSQPPCDTSAQLNAKSYRRSNSKQVSHRVSSSNHNIATITYELNVLRTRGPRKMHCVMHSVPISSIQEGGTAPTPSSFPHYDHLAYFSTSKGKESIIDTSSSSLTEPPPLSPVNGSVESLILNNKAPRWHEQLQCWCLNFKGRVTVASVKNFQLVAVVDPCHNVSAAEQEKVLMQMILANVTWKGGIDKGVCLHDFGNKMLPYLLFIYFITVSFILFCYLFISSRLANSLYIVMVKLLIFSSFD